MKKIALFLMALFAVQTAMAIDHVIITEVLYDPVKDDNGGEALQVYNPTESPVSIGGWIVRTSSYEADATIPANVMLQPGRYYLIADAGWSADKDSEALPDADYEESMTMKNIDGGVAIVNNGTVVDSVGWGNADIYEGIPSNATAEGKSLQRKKQNGIYVDTDSNKDDFFPAEPSFRQADNGGDEGEITVIAVVGGSAPEITEFAITDDDSIVAGFQVVPFPGKTRVISFRAFVADPNGADDINKVTIKITNLLEVPMQRVMDVNSTTALFEFNLSVSFNTRSGNYSATVNVSDKTRLNATKTSSFEIQSLLAMAFDSSTVIFNTMPGATAELKGDDNMSTSNLTIRNIGNTPLNLKLSSAGLASGQGVMPAESLLYSIGSSSYKPFKAAYQSEQLGLLPAAAEKLSLTLVVPAGTTPGNYTGRISIMAVA